MIVLKNKTLDIKIFLNIFQNIKNKLKIFYVSKQIFVLQNTKKTVF